MDLPVAPAELMPAPVRLNLGCGGKRLPGYLGVDLSPAADVVADVKALPFPDDHAQEILAVHLLEHLYRWEAEPALLEWRRVLKPGGLLVLELPDIVKVARNILGSADQRLGLWGAYGDPAYREPLMVHRWGWSLRELRDVLRNCGFRNIKFGEPEFHKKKRDMRAEATK